MNGQDPHPPYVRSRSVAHGLDAGNVRLRHDTENDAAYIELDPGNIMDIRIQLRPHGSDIPGRHAAELERDRKGLRRLAAVATQLAQEIERIQQGGAP